MTDIRTTNQHGEPLAIVIGGITYTPAELQQHIARSQALATVAIWLEQAEAELHAAEVKAKRLRRLLGLWQRHNAKQQGQIARLRQDVAWQQENNKRMAAWIAAHYGGRAK